ncbi:MAG: hypothetical protein Q9170_006904 [Blastenia crenularia]
MGFYSSFAALLTRVLALSGAVPVASKVLPSFLTLNVTQFAVRSLPNLTFPLPTSWAGQIPIPGASNNKLFFWLFDAESHNASQNLISQAFRSRRCSSMTGLTHENGPLQFSAGPAVPNPNRNSWTKLASVLYVGDKATLNIADITEDFLHWLIAFYSRFPALKDKNTYIIGESYAGIYIPYFAKALLSNRNLLSINLKAITLGDPTFGNNAAMTDVVTTTYLHQISSIYKIPSPILQAFDAADHKCGFDKVLSQLTYPPKAPSIIPGNPEGLNFLHQLKQPTEKHKRQTPCFPTPPTTPSLINASVSAPCSLGCATYTTAFAYLSTLNKCFDPYNIHTTCEDNRNDTSSSISYLNRADVKKAIHAPEKVFQECNDTVFDTQSQEYVEPPAYNILPELLGKGVRVHVYSGDWDGLLNHWGAELVVGNMTWLVNGQQGFSVPPNRTFEINGTCVASWGYERGLSYHHILRAGHMAPHDQPRVMFEYLKQFVLGREGFKL